MKYEDGYEESEFEDETENDNGEFEVDDEAIIEAINVDLMQGDRNYRILEQAIKVASQDWFWSFKSENAKVKKISRLYKRMSKIIEKE